MEWSGYMQRHGWSEQVVGSEPFHPLSLLAKQHRDQGLSVATIACNLGTSGEFGACRAGFTVTIECPQTEGHMNMAGEAAFLKARELTNDAARSIGAPLLP